MMILAQSAARIHTVSQSVSQSVDKVENYFSASFEVEGTDKRQDKQAALSF